MDKVITNGNIVPLQKRGKTSIVSATLQKGIMTDDTAQYKIISREPLEIKINSTIEIFGKTYRVNNKPQWQKTAENSYSYDVTFEGVMYDLRKCMLFNADDTGFKTDSDFSLIGNIEVFLLCLKNNVKRLSPNWMIGTFENKETKTITFSKDNCLTALQKICQEFKLEFRIDNVNGINIINIGNFGQKLNYVFEYGKGKGLYDLSCTNVDENGIINRMYVAGGSENLPTAYHGYSSNLKLPGGLDYLEDAASIAFMGLKEGFIDFPDVFPHRTGVISAIDPNKNIFFDASMDFDLNEKEEDGITTKYLKPDVTAKVHFNTGNLAGYEFEIKKGGYNHSTKKFEIIPITNEQGLVFPSETADAFQFAIGDEYVIIDIYYPEIYVTNAESELLVKASEQFPLNLQPKVNYKLRVDERFLRSKVDFAEDVPFDLGDTLTVIDQILGVNKEIKIVSFTRNILSPFVYEIEIADSYEVNSSSLVALQIIGINNGIKTQGSVISQNYLNGYKRLNELRDLTFDPDGYFDTTKIKPSSIETGMLSVGAKSQQLTLEGVTIEPNYETENKIYFSAGKLIHFSIAETITEWNFIETIVDSLDPLKPYYVYAQCEKSGDVGQYYVTEEKIQFDSRPAYYYFLLGVSHKVNNGFRFYTALEGATMINGRYITTGRVQSVDNSTWFDLDLASFSLGDNAGMTGNIDNDIFLWGGGTFASRETAKRAMTRSGVDIWRHPNGAVGFEIGIIDGRLVLNGYSKNGGKLYELGERGLIALQYIPESWVINFFRQLTSTETASDSDLITELTDLVIRTNQTQNIRGDDGLPKLFYISNYELTQNFTAYEYYNGTHPENATYATDIGYKNTDSSRTDNIADGWYVMRCGIVYTKISETSGYPDYSFVITVNYISAGKVINVKNLTITK